MTIIKYHRKVIQFCFIFSLCIGSSAAILLRESNPINATLKAVIAKAAGFMLSLFGSDIQVFGNTVQANGASFQIITACTGIFTMAIFLSAVIAYPCRIKTKLVGIAIGLLTIFSVNLVRVISLYYVSLYWPGFFEKAHLLVWQSLIIFVAVLTYIFWLERFANAKVNPPQK